MYSQEKFANVRQQGKAIISDGPIELYSGSYTRKEINNIVKGLEY